MWSDHELVFLSLAAPRTRMAAPDANGVGRDTLASWLRCRYRITSGAPGTSAAGGLRYAGSSIPGAWLKRLHGFLQRVDWGDPTLWVSRANTPWD